MADADLFAQTGFMMAWSVVSLLTYLTHDFKSMLLARFFLGITEAPVRLHLATHMQSF
jgi:hypothetical protein